ncbi:MAG: glycosyltransferase family 2 protein [Armatimonadetes bacterium]|nr:glycosyltransferase family 2 protein [Armatimonadota bacterium]
MTLLIPARNEADRIGETLRGAWAGLRSLALGDAQVIVIDDGSSDETARAAWEGGATEVVRLEVGRGKGGALNAGLRQATGEVIVTLDADLGASASEVAKLIPPVRDDQADMTIAAFPSAGRSGGFGSVVKLARWGIRHATGQEIEAPLSGQRALRRSLLKAVGGFAEGFGVETGLTLAALRQGYRVQVVPTTMRHRALGRTPAGFLHRGRQFLDVARVLIRQRAWRRQGD